MLLVTHQCNLRCSYCYEHKEKSNHMSISNAKLYISEVVNSLDESYQSFEVQFMGGEPLLQFPLIKEVSEWLWQAYFPISLDCEFAPTNGTLIDQEMKKWFSANRDRICLGLSFDGNRLMQNVNRSNSATQVDLDFFKNTWPNQSVKMTISPNTISMLRDGVVFLHKQGFRHITADLAMGKEVVWKDEHLKLYRQQLGLLSDYYLEHPQIPRLSLLNLDIRSLFLDNDNKKKCSCGEDLVCIDTDGTEYACHLFSPATMSEEQAKASLAIDFTDHSAFIPDDCGDCLLFLQCPCCYGMNFLCYGNVSTQSAFTCQAFKIQFLANCELQHRLAITRNDKETINLIDKIINNI